jgi:DNA-binding NarL/FixJ family response regulator
MSDAAGRPSSGDAAIRVLIADDQALVRAGFRSLLDRAADIEVVGEAVDGADAVVQARLLRPDVVLMDVRMPVLDGIAATERLAADPALAGTRVIVVTTYELDEYIHRALRAGASGFLLKDLGSEELRRAVRVVVRGEALLAPSVTRRLISEFTRRGAGAGPELRQRVGGLSAREREVLTLVGRGLSNDEIAAELVISPATAKTHVSHAMTKLDARDRAQLVVYAYETGLV